MSHGESSMAVRLPVRFLIDERLRALYSAWGLPQGEVGEGRASLKELLPLTRDGVHTTRSKIYPNPDEYVASVTLMQRGGGPALSSILTRYVAWLRKLAPSEVGCRLTTMSGGSVPVCVVQKKKMMMTKKKKKHSYAPGPATMGSDVPAANVV